MKRVKRSVSTDTRPSRSQLVDLTDTQLDEELDELLKAGQKQLAIDKHALDEALEVQPVVFYDISQRLALQTSRRDALKQQLLVVEAEVDETIRRVGLTESGDKLTEKLIEAEKRRHPDTVQCMKAYLRASYYVNELSALKEAFIQRSYVLKELVSLHIANYYGDQGVRTNTNSMKDTSADYAKRGMAEQRRSIKRKGPRR